MGSTPVAKRVSTSPLNFIKAISAAMAVPLRPITMTLTSNGPSSRMTNWASNWLRYASAPKADAATSPAS